MNDRSSISPDPFWVVADGLDLAQLTITVRDANGNPLPNKVVALSSTRGVLQQPSSPTDANGVTTAVITSTVPGDAYITARNITDDQPLSALAAIHFWNGGKDSAGLIDPGGVPYLSPQLRVEGLPFQAGFPVNFRIPMQNSNTDPVDVKVVYAVSRLNIGVKFTPVDEVSATLQPGEAWDALGVWLPAETGHHCVQATVEVTLPDNLIVRAPAKKVEVGPFTVNFNVPNDPCKKLNVDKLTPTPPTLPGLPFLGVVVHFNRAYIQAVLAAECLNQGLSFGSNLNLTTSPATDRVYQQVVTPPVYTPPPLLPGGDVTSEQATISTELGEVAADLASLDVALQVTSQRIQWAGQAGDKVASALQLNAYQEFQRTKAQKLADLAASIDDLLDVTEGSGEPDTIFLPQDYQNYLDSLKSSGFEPDVIAFLQQFGLSSEEIDARLQAEIARYEELDAFLTTSFYESLREIRDASLKWSNELFAQYGSGQGLDQFNSANTPATYFLDATTSDFLVGNPMGVKKTVELRVRPVDIPIGWTYHLNNPTPTLLAGETTTVTLTLEPDKSMIEDTEIRLAVEGYIDGEYIGGILFTRQIPKLTPSSDSTIYLPLVTK